MILYVMADSQINEKTLRFIGELGLRERVHFLIDRGSGLIDRMGLRKRDPEPIEYGVPYPATYLLDREGVIRLVDVREDFHIWLDPDFTSTALSRIP